MHTPAVAASVCPGVLCTCLIMHLLAFMAIYGIGQMQCYTHMQAGNYA